MISDYIFKGKSNEDLSRLRMALIEIVKEETLPYDPTKPDKKQKEMKILRDRLTRRLNKAFNINCRY